ncbi:MAG: electron transfer flavoprotein subunit alpha/FixB family protein [Actinomycetes bacterium]
MSEVLVLVEHTAGEVKKVSLELLAMAAGIGEPSAVVLGPGADAAVATLGDHGAKTVYVSTDQAFVDHVVVPTVDVLAKLVAEKSPAAVLIPSSADGKEIAGRLAIATDSGVITDAVAVSSDAIATQNVFGGATIVHSKVSKGTPIITVRTNSIAPVQSGGAASRVDVAVDLTALASSTKVTNRVSVEKSGRPDLSEAAIVVSGGRGVGSDEGFKTVIEPLADALGAAVGASRAATDAGWYPHQFQVGQTGKTVSPQLYIANGISGAIQHRAGMQTSKTVVVVNKDADAPIFDLADFGVVGDLHSVVPDLTTRVKSHK